MRWRRGYWWRVYWLGAVLACAGLGWLSRVLLDFEQEKLTARAETEREQAVRLALTRMDSWIAPLLARESARPYFEYLAFVPHDRAYTRLLNRIQPGEVFSPSPLLTFESRYFPLHFLVDASGDWSSPQVPSGNQLDLAQASMVNPETIGAKQALLLELRKRLPLETAVMAMGCVATDWNNALVALPDESTTNPAQVVAEANQMEWGVTEQKDELQARMEGSDYQRRVLKNFNVVNGLNDDAEEVRKLGQQWMKQQTMPGPNPSAQRLVEVPQSGWYAFDGQPESGALELGPFLPVWLPDAKPTDPVQLCFLRNVKVGEVPFVQGFSAHWPSLRDAMMLEIADLFPGCEVALQPRASFEGKEGRRLAAVPAELVLSAPPAPVLRGMTPARTTVGLLWFAALATLAGLGFSLRAGLAYADRRSRFASSVTHELRTPLTTFRMYTEMLAGDVITDEAHRKTYLQTLQAEADRLSVLVENVLAYARLEEGRTRPARESSGLSQLVDRHVDALERRVHEAGGTFALDLLAPPQARVTTDASAIGQILFNLVDNACKYGHGAAPPRVQLTVSVEDSLAVLRVIDDGPGVPEKVRGRIFHAFDRGRVAAEDENPGIGLGLALCLGLARELGGDLRLERTDSGACFRLELPLDARA
ncbi:MAG: HAMP domain-containing histidine kinase [Planctomycetes bacterium]|nr:HAMP domain-containing histidine kinase [Planctomycetota bacterium]